MIDESTEFGARAARHLREDLVVWLTTVSPSGAPTPMPVWFLWTAPEELLVYSVDGARTRNLAVNPSVALNFDGDRRGGDIVVLSGRATIFSDAVPSAADNPDYLAKYGERIARIGPTPEAFAQKYSVPIAIQLTKLRGH